MQSSKLATVSACSPWKAHRKEPQITIKEDRKERKREEKKKSLIFSIQFIMKSMALYKFKVYTIYFMNLLRVLISTLLHDIKI